MRNDQLPLKGDGVYQPELLSFSTGTYFIARATEALEDGQVVLAATFVDAAYEIFRLKLERVDQPPLSLASL